MHQPSEVWTLKSKCCGLVGSEKRPTKVVGSNLALGTLNLKRQTATTDRVVHIIVFFRYDTVG